jgi:hypothetical protein
VRASPEPSRLRLAASRSGVRVEISPPVSRRGPRRRLLFAGGGLAVGALPAFLRLSAEWHATARGVSGLPVTALLLLTACVALAFPLAGLGLLSLLFAEETIELDERELRQEIALFGRDRRSSLPRPLSIELTRRPVPPWWTWTFLRLAARHGRRRLGLGATLGTSEKRQLKEVLRRALDAI